jgi:hypothetical protein
MPKNRNTLLKNMAVQESWSHIFLKINARIKSTLAAQSALRNTRRRQQTSPSDHYHIAKHPRASLDLTSWLTDIKDDDSAKRVGFLFL